jgi:Flp pilus assembly protein TadB
VKMQQRQDSRTRQRSTLSYLAFLGVIALAAIVVAHTVMHSVFLWLMIAVVAFFFLRHEQGRRR